MTDKLKNLVIKIVFSPIWIGLLLSVLFLHGFNISFRAGWKVKPIKDIFTYWKL